MEWVECECVGLLTGMYAVTGTLFNAVKRGENDGKVCILYFFKLGVGVLMEHVS